MNIQEWLNTFSSHQEVISALSSETRSELLISKVTFSPIDPPEIVTVLFRQITYPGSLGPEVRTVVLQIIVFIPL